MLGDLKHGRTVHSLATCLSKFNVKMNFVSPKARSLSSRAWPLQLARRLTRALFVPACGVYASVNSHRCCGCLTTCSTSCAKAASPMRSTRTYVLSCVLIGSCLRDPHVCVELCCSGGEGVLLLAWCT